MRFRWLIIGISISCACQSLTHPSLQQPLTEEPSLGEETTTASPDTLVILAIDVGQGDATFVVSPDGNGLLIDAGPPGSGPLLQQAAASLEIHSLTHVVATHYDSDHIGAIDEWLAGNDTIPFTADDPWPTEGLWDRGLVATPETHEYQDYATLTALARAPLSPGQVLAFADGVEIRCVIVDGQVAREGSSIALFPEETLEENARSVGLLIRYGNFRYWTGGDLPGGEEEKVDVEGAIAALIGPVDVLHTHHHGSKTSSSNAFLATLAPTVALISAGADNPYGHPHPDVVERLLDHGIDLYESSEGSLLITAQSSGDFTVNGSAYNRK